MNKSCPHCHQANPSEAAFCLNCASPLHRAQSGNASWQSDQQPNQPNFGGQNFAPPAVAASAGASQRAITALVLAFAGLVCCGPLTSIPAVILGWMEVNAIKQGQSSQSGMWMAMVGLWGGILVTVLQLAGFLLWFVISMAATSDPYYY